MRLLFLLRIALRGIWDCLKVVAFGAGCFLALIGAVAVADAFRPPNLPTIRPMSAKPYSRWVIPQIEELSWGSDKGWWEEMRVALCILDEVCPEVSAWVRERYQSGHLFFETADKHRFAAWWIVPQMLEIDLCALAESDAELACTLAHEFRHSRQPYLLTVQSQLSRLAGLDRTQELVEADAYAFEERVRRAIRGEKP